MDILSEFKERETEFLKSGGKFIVPLPQAQIIGYDFTRDL